MVYYFAVARLVQIRWLGEVDDRPEGASSRAFAGALQTRQVGEVDDRHEGGRAVLY